MKPLIHIALLLLCATLHAQWITVDSLNTQRQEMPSVVLNGKIYCAGGIAQNLSTLQSVEIYDPATNTWSPGPDMPKTLHHHAMVTLNGKIYVIGGYASVAFDAQSSVYMFDPDSGKWFAKMELPFEVGAADAVAYNGKIYLFGGKNNSGTQNTTLEYNPVNDTWTGKDAMARPREHLCAAVSGNKIYVIAGRGSTGADTTVEVYDPQNNSWSRGKPLPTGRSGCDAATVNGKIFVMGGESPGIFDENEMFDPVTNTWSTQPPMPHGRHGLGVVAIGDTIYTVAGGVLAGFSTSTICEAFIFNDTTTTDTIGVGINAPMLINDKFACYYDKASRALKLNITIAITDQCHCDILDAQGKLVMLLDKGLGLHEGVNTVNLGTEGLPTGMYIAVLQQGQQKLTKKFMVAD